MRNNVTRELGAVLAVASLATAAWAQSPEGATVPPQTARQALIEMFFSKTPGTFMKHLPAATLKALANSGALSTLQQYSLLASQFQTKEKTFETFETGSIMVAASDPQAGTKFEMTVENDSLQGDEDDIAVTYQTYREKQLQQTPLTPRATFAMKKEDGVWKLNELRFSFRLPLADPDFLKSVTETIKARAAASPLTQPQVQNSTTTIGNDASVIAAVRSIVTAETTYSKTYRPVGYTCTLSDLDGFGGGEPNEHQAMLIASGLASGKKFGYVFALSGCTGTPAGSFHLAATPGGSSFGRRAYCSDESGVIRSSADGNAATCLASGIPAQ